MRFGTRLVFGALAVIIVTAATLVVAANLALRRHLEAAFAEELERNAHLVAVGVDEIPREQLNAAAHRYGRLLERRVTLIDGDGVVVGDSDFDDESLALLDNHRARPEVRTALADTTGVARRLSVSTHRAELKVAIAAPPGVVRISAPLEQVDALIRTATRSIVVAALLAVLLGSLLATLLGRTVAQPLRDLATSARTVSGGGKPTYPHSSVSEIRELVRAFRVMHGEVSARIAELRREREETETLIASMVEGVIAADDRGRITVCNAATRAILGYGPDDALPNLPELFHHAEARGIVDRALAGTPTGGQEIDLHGRAVLMTARPLPEGGAILGMLDVSALRRLQTVRRDFVANISHELKTPLTSIAGYAETLLQDEVDADTRKRFLEVINDNAQRMRRLIDDLLELSRLESGGWRPEIRLLDLEQAVANAWAGFAGQARTRGIDFRLDTPAALRVRADPEALRHVLDNLFSNAVRHTPPGGSITVRAASVNGGTHIEVSDTGSGIPMEHVHRVFERFYRADPGRARHLGGTGLGLAIVKHLVEAHGGVVALESAVQRGTTVRVRFPSEP